jgi:hypothetical protein
MGDRDGPSPISLTNNYPSSHGRSILNAGHIKKLTIQNYYQNGAQSAAIDLSIAGAPAPDNVDQPSLLPDSSTLSPAQPTIKQEEDANKLEDQNRSRWQKLSTSRLFNARWKRSLAIFTGIAMLGTVITFTTLNSLHILPHRPAQSVPTFFNLTTL